jgi:hypothetical protein
VEVLSWVLSQIMIPKVIAAIAALVLS